MIAIIYVILITIITFNVISFTIHNSNRLYSELYRKEDIKMFKELIENIDKLHINSQLTLKEKGFYSFNYELDDSICVNLRIDPNNTAEKYSFVSERDTCNCIVSSFCKHYSIKLADKLLELLDKYDECNNTKENLYETIVIK